MPVGSLWGSAKCGGPIREGGGEEGDWAEELTFGAFITEASANCAGCFEAGVSLQLAELRQEPSMSTPNSKQASGVGCPWSGGIGPCEAAPFGRGLPDTDRRHRSWRLGR